MERAFVYGDLLFETMAVVEGNIRHVRDHAARLNAGLKYLGLPATMDVNKLESLLRPAVREQSQARIRLIAYSKADGFYRSSSKDVQFEVEVFPLPDEQKKIQQIGIYPGDWKPTSPLSNFKTGNALVYIQALKFAADKGWDDVLILNQYGHICEAASSNLFWVKDGQLFTPPLSEGCVMGVMRAVLLRHLPMHDFELEEKPAVLMELLQADELFLTNAIHRIQSVECLDGKLYADTLTAKIRNTLE
ncbi:MAG: aminotransferase class IV [Bacteroidia bacterium]|jgi:branched-chain amino acid aminotransferase